MYTLPLHAATSVVANNALPNFDKVMSGALEQNPVISNNGLTMDITQTTHNAVIKWNSFDVGGSATVNFWGPDNHNTLNYVNSANMSQIYGTINANNNGKIFIVNPAGVQIGNSAQINVGSLYVSNSKLTDDALKAVDANNINFDFNAYMKYNGAHTDAALMSLGNINANKVTFEGDGRIVIDSERIKNSAGDAKLTADKILVNTKDKNNVVIGYEAYDETNGYGKVDINTAIATVNGSAFTKANGYMWVEDVEQLQAIGKNANTLSGNYALRNSIDATSTEQNGFTSIGSDDSKAFTGNFDGIDYNIFGLTIKNGGENTGLFGYTNNATISNVTLVGGSITGSNNVGAIVGNANNTTLTNVVNSAAVSGDSNVGGIVGSATNTTVEDAINTCAIEGRVNTGGNGGINVGGLIGSMNSSHLIGNSYNLGDVSGDGYNVGGLVGSAVNSTIGNPSVVDGKPVENVQVVYNRLDVSGAYNVGGIVGNMEGSTVQNAENSGNVLATGYKTEDYIYHSAEDDGRLNNNKLVDGTFENISNGVYEVTVSTNVANAGGIAGTSSGTSTITNVTNTANVSSNTNDYTQYGSEHEYYTAGNVGGIVGRAEDTDITNATNQENEIRGAHNVGGVAGYLGGNSTVSGGINDGGDIMATGARNENGFVSEVVRPIGNSQEVFIIGNIGGVVGYMDGDNVYVTGSANRGTVHSQDIAAENAANVLDTSKAANVGGIVGKIDRINTKGLDKIKADALQAAVSNSYNTGDVRGYTGVGGVVGMMYNGEVAGSYNLGHLRTTRIATDSSNIEAVNMGGIVGDTTEGTQANAVIYDVYNKGQIGDDTYTYYARHVGGIVGRLSGDISKAYNNGEIYNGYTATGGVVGWMYKGSVNNAFNTGNITVYNHDESTSQVGGIVGAAGTANGKINITNVYNLGTLRSIKANAALVGIENHKIGNNAVGGIIGAVMNKGTVNISGAYTTGNIYAGVQNEQGSMELDTENDMVGSIYGENRGVKDNTGYMEYADIKRTNTYYIRPEDGVGFTQLGTYVNNKLYGSDNSNKWINYNGRFNKNEYQYDNSTGEGSLSFSSQSAGGAVTGNTDDNWRLYPDGTPILNAFLPDSEKYFEQHGLQDDTDKSFNGSIQYGTAYDPLLTIINTNRDLSFDFGSAEDGKLSITNAAGLVVYGGGLTLKDFTTSSGTGYFGGIIYSDGALAINAADGEGLGFGSGSDLYGSSVTLKADGSVTVYGDIVATGNETKTGDNPDEAGSINITSDNGDVNVYGTLTSATAGESVTIPGISGAPDSNWHPVDAGDSVSDPSDSLNTIGERYEHTTTASAVNGNITITANGKTDKEGNLVSGGNVNLYFGNKGEGITTTGGDLTVTGTGDVYVDSDLDIGGNLTLNGTGADSEVVLDITNIGQVQAKNGTVTDAVTGLHNFMHHFSNTDGGGTQAGHAVITLNAEQSGDAKLAVDMWDYESNSFDLKKYDSNGHTFKDELDEVTIRDIDNNELTASEVTYIWVTDADQLQGINNNGTDGLEYNYALKGDINASDVEDYVAIGTGSGNGFTGTFDGRGNRIIGLTVDGKDIANAGIFDTIGTNGVVKDVNIYSGNFTGTAKAGAVAGENNGRIEGVVTFGNTVTVTGEGGNAGGIVGVNNGNNGKIVTNEDGTITLEPVDDELPVTGIIDVESTGSVIAGGSSAVAGGLVGTNDGALGNSYSNSAVTANKGTGSGLGGVVGVNTANGNVQYVDSLGVTNGGAHLSNNVGGIIGINNGNMYSGYNESIVSGKDKVGGIIGENSTGGTVTNIVNAISVTGENESADNVSQYVGGLVGSNSGSVTNGRNNGTITGTKYVGGMVGSNAKGATLTNITNDSSAAIEGEQYVGGIAGSNAGKISATDDTLINRGSITGNKFVGGVAGVNEAGGTIENTISNIELNVKTPYTNDGNLNNDPAFFGGVVGQNSGTIIGATNQSSVDVAADGATYVGGIIGQNTKTGSLQGEILNAGTVTGLSNVGGIIGENQNAQILNNADGQTRLQITNTGNVRAETGGAAGIFYNNNITGGEDETNANAINNVDIINRGTVTGGTDADSITGGLFGINSGNITNSTLTNTGVVTGGGTVGGLIGTNSGSAKDSTFTNSGTVSGNTNVGGLFGTNSGKFERSSLINTVNGQVSGTNNVGGLIGYNTGEIIGGRKDVNGTDVGYYKYKIYNNGVITIKGNGSNIGGLIGNNTTENGKTGSLTAGYNTGAINAANSENVGGIAGSNAGTIDQVFNTVMTENGQNQTIAGGTNVGGLVGTNSGTLSNAYNTTEVKGNANVGTIIGNNATNNVSNVYNTWDTENSKLISTGNSADKAYNIDSNKQTDYSGLDFNDTWKIYEGNSNPLLKVFLTNLTIKDINNEGTSLKEFLNLVYNGKEQDLNIKALIDNGFIVVPDEEAFKAYHNTLIGNNLGESYLINNTDGQKTAGKHNNWLYSEQIHVNTSGEFNPNNLGYDITFANNDKGILEIDKAKLTITLDDIYRIYGQEGLKDGYEYGFSIDGLADSDKNLANDIIIEEGTIEDGALVDINNDGKVTNDVNDIDNPYKWTADVTLSDYIEQNYNILYDGGNSHVTKAGLTITADNKETMPGVMPDFTGTDIQQGLVNGDSAGTYDYNLDGSVNIDVDGTYTDKIGISFDNGETYYDLENVDWSTIPGWDFLKNYDINFKPGTLIVSSELLPDIPSDWPHNRWDYLFNDAPFDRTKDFRERKAEVNFVDGGMEI